MQSLRRQDWPGNVRELENTIEKVYVLSQSRILEAEGFEADPAARAPAFASGNGSAGAPPSYAGDYPSRPAPTADEAIRLAPDGRRGFLLRSMALRSAGVRAR